MSSWQSIGASTTPAPTFSPASLASQIDSAIAAVQRDKRGALLISADLSKASAALLVKCGPVDLVARVVKPYSGPLQADVSARVNFAVGEPGQCVIYNGEACTVSEVLAQQPEPPLLLRDYYAILRHTGNSRFWSALKALAVQAGASVPLLPADTVL